MKGVVFTEFMEMVEKNWDLDMVDDLIDSVGPESGGSYTTVGTYSYEELVAYVVELNKKTGIEVPKLVHTFGVYLAKSFSDKFPDFFTVVEDTFDFLKKVDDHIHVEVQKLYPDAELPKFRYEEVSEDVLVMYYESSRSLPDLAHGLIEGSANYFGQNIEIVREGKSENGVHHEKFTLSLQHGQ